MEVDGGIGLASMRASRLLELQSCRDRVRLYLTHKMLSLKFKSG